MNISETKSAWLWRKYNLEVIEMESGDWENYEMIHANNVIHVIQDLEDEIQNLREIGSSYISENKDLKEKLKWIKQVLDGMDI